MVLTTLVVTVLQVVFLSQIALASVLKSRLNVENHYRKAIGDVHIDGIFPSTHFLSESINQARNILVTKSVGSSRRLADDTSDKDHLVGCIEYNNVPTTLNFLKEKQITHHVSYTSASENLLCLYLFLTPEDVAEIEDSDMITFTMLEPVPAIIKLDRSVHQLQYDFLAPAATAPADLIASDTLHPIVNDILSGTKSTLSVMVRSGTSREVQEALVDAWLQPMRAASSAKRTQSLSSNSFAEHIYWASSHISTTTNVDISNTSSTSADLQSRFRGSGKRTRDAVNRNRLLGRALPRRKTRTSHTKSLSAADRSQLEEKSTAWRSWAETLAHMRAENVHEEMCGTGALEVRHHPDNVIITLPEQMLAVRSGKFHSNGEPQVLVRGHANAHARIEVGTRSLTPQEVSGACFAQLIASITADPMVTRVALSRPMQTLNSLARQITQLGSLGSEPFSNLGLDGTGVVIGISDTGIDETSCFFRDTANGKVTRSTVANPITDTKYRKVIQYIAYSGSGGDYASGHGSHVAGTVAGMCAYENDNAVKNVNRGMASGAKIAFFDIGINDAKQDLAIPEDLAKSIFSTAHSAGARIHSNSWGGGYLYDAFTLATDAFLYKQEDFLAIFAAGNSGTAGAYTVNSPALSKNCLAVACSNTGHTANSNIDHIASFSSHGPALDGRIKPDITAPGNYLVSVQARSEGSNGSGCGTTSKSGTSMATPVVAGTAGLILQYFQDAKFWAKLCDPQYALCKNGAFTPSGVLLKALLLQSGKPVSGYDGNGAVSLGSSLPDSYQGFGRLNLASLLPQIVYSNSQNPFNLFVDQQQLPELSERTYIVHVTSSAQPLKVTLSWFDPPNEVFAARFLLHDLDLLLESPSGQVYHGNAAVTSSGGPALGASRDELNNNEQVTISAPAAGAWTVRVQTKRLTQALVQKFAVVITTKGTIAPSATVTTLSPSILTECHISTGTPSTTPQVSLEVAKFSKLVANGWSATDSYHVVSSEGESVFSGTGVFTTSHSYETDRVCVPAGCYTASLSANSTSSKKGTQMSIPECGVYLSPMSPQQSFCVEPAYQDAALEVPVFASNPCLSSCEREKHVILPLYLGEYYEGAGWSGTYYSFTRTFASPPEGHVDSFAANSAGSGSMDWGFEEISTQCLPAEDACYALQLSIPASLVTKDEEYPVLRIMDTILTGTDLECPFEMNTTVTLAKFCVTVHDTVATTAITYYTQSGTVYDVGQAKTSWSALAKTQEASRITAIGTCTSTIPVLSRTQSLNEFKPSDPPTILPSAHPVAAPTTAPSNKPVATPTAGPSAAPTTVPSVTPSVLPTAQPSAKPTEVPSTVPSFLPTVAPSVVPSHAPTYNKTAPTPAPTLIPSALPSVIPTPLPTVVSTVSPTVLPTVLKTSAPSAIPSALPSAAPSVTVTAVPSVSFAETIAEVYGNHSFACLSDCAGYPGEAGLAGDMESTCYFLLDIFHLCSSYSVAYGLCEVPACAADCTPQEWCYFGGGTVVSCPELMWMGQTADAARIVDQCVSSVNATANIVADDDEDVTTDSGGSKTTALSSGAKATIIIFVLLIVIAAIVGAIFCMNALRKNGDGTHNQLPTESSHALFNAAGESSEHGAGGHTLEDGSASHTRNKPSGLSTERAKDLLTRSASFLKGVGRKASPRGAGSKLATAKENKGSKSSAYAVVRSPFSIGDEDDEEDEGFHESDGSNDIHV